MRLTISGYNDAAEAWEAVNTAGLECVSPLEKSHALLWRISELVEAKTASATLRLGRQYAELTEFVYVRGAVVTCPQCTCLIDVLLSISVPETRQHVEFLPVTEHHSVPVDLSPDSSVDFSPISDDQPAPEDRAPNTNRLTESFVDTAMTAAGISKAYGDHLKLSPNSEKVTESFVDTAMTIGGANSAGKQANKMTGSVNMSKRGHVALVHFEETVVEAALRKRWKKAEDATETQDVEDATAESIMIVRANAMSLVQSKYFHMTQRPRGQ